MHGDRYPGVYIKEYAMTHFSVNATRLDPYKNFKFRLKWDGKYVYGGSKLTGMKRITDVVEHIKIENEGFERDLSATGPTEPTLTSLNA
jgi:hypothetical protein